MSDSSTLQREQAGRGTCLEILLPAGRASLISQPRPPPAPVQLPGQAEQLLGPRY